MSLAVPFIKPMIFSRNASFLGGGGGVDCHNLKYPPSLAN